ncbi:unnamed protein product [Paramecium primaurelia]|uniref:Cyclin-like domain-containing protein n=1 Tax=Paramecium primaurelia TaxID=5886 RepID=A0A8S1M889_PARPR|nr:unnamed protein product [Paramecium primaurelia]
MQKRQVKIEMLNPSRCLTQSRSPKQNLKLTQPLILKQITQLIKNSKERNTERLCKPYEKLNYIQHIQPSTTSRPMQSHDLSTTFHQLLQEFRNYKKQNKENSFNKINKPFKKERQISFPNAIHLNNSSNNINSIKDKLYLNKRESNGKLAQTILSIAQASNSQNNYRLQFNGIIEDCSQKQYNYLYEVKKNMKNDDSHYKKNSQRCASADIQLVVRSTNQKTRSSSIDRNESRFLGSTQANSIPKEIDLTCDENEIIVHNINFDERIGTEPDPLINQERQYLVDPYYLIKQNEITWLIRAIVIDWMMETAMGIRLKRQIFHLSIYYLDSYLSKKQANKKNIQLVGLTSLLIANKIEEVNPICLMQFQKAANNGYKQSDILNMELDILFVIVYCYISRHLNGK